MADKIAETNPLAGLTDLLDLVKGKSQTTTNTTKSNLSQAGVQELIDQILRSNQGLASVAQGQKTAGLYNSTVNQQLINDLITRTTASVAAQQAGQTTSQTVKTNPQVKGMDILTTLGILGGSKLLGPSVKGLGKKLGIDNVGNDLADFLGLGSNTSAAGGGSTVSLGTDASMALSDIGGTAPGLGAADSLSLGSGSLDILGALGFGSEVGAGAGGAEALTLGADASTAFGGTEAALSTDALTLGGTEAATAGASAGIAGSGVTAAPIIAGGTFGAYQAKQVADGDVGDLVDSFFPGLGNATEQIGKTIGDIFGW